MDFMEILVTKYLRLASRFHSFYMNVYQQVFDIIIVDM